jgi:gamma-glutamyltranspeptidase
MKRPLSSMSPTLVLKDGRLVMATGSPGGSRIITVVLQVIVNVIDHGLNVAEAENAPRAHDQLFPDALMVERGMSPDTIRQRSPLSQIRRAGRRAHRRVGFATKGNAGGRILIGYRKVRGKRES